MYNYIIYNLIYNKASLVQDCGELANIFIYTQKSLPLLWRTLTAGSLTHSYSALYTYVSTTHSSHTFASILYKPEQRTGDKCLIDGRKTYQILPFYEGSNMCLEVSDMPNHLHDCKSHQV